jgi:hypothetical protein
MIDENSKHLLIIYLIYLVVINLFRFLANYFLIQERKQGKEKEKSSDELELDELKILARKYNNMDDFVKYSKINRKVLELEKKIKKSKSDLQESENKISNNGEESTNDKNTNNMFNNYLNNYFNTTKFKFKFIISIITYVRNIYLNFINFI